MRDGHGPRWRLLCRLSTTYPPDTRKHFMGRLAGLFREGNTTVLAAESWTLSQAYYYGAVDHNPEHHVKLTEGETLDQLDELDLIALPKPTRLGRPEDDNAPHQPGRAEASIEDIRAALGLIVNNWVDWPEWNALALALYAASGGSADGYQAFVDWSRQNPRFDAGETERMWQHIHTHPPTRSGFGSLVFWARRIDPDFLRPRPDPLPPLLEDTPAAATPQKASRFGTFRRCRPIPRPRNRL